MNLFNDEREDEEWLYSHPRYGGHSTPIGVLIQQDYALLSSIRSSMRNHNKQCNTALAGVKLKT